MANPFDWHGTSRDMCGQVCYIFEVKNLSGLRKKKRRRKPATYLIKARTEIGTNIKFYCRLTAGQWKVWRVPRGMPNPKRQVSRVSFGDSR